LLLHSLTLTSRSDHRDRIITTSFPGLTGICWMSLADRRKTENVRSQTGPGTTSGSHCCRYESRTLPIIAWSPPTPVA